MSRHYSITELRAFCDIDSPKSDFVTDSFRDDLLRSADERGDADTTANLDAISAGCQWLQSQIEQPVGQTYNDWLATAVIMSRCRGGRERFHANSKADNRYTYTEADAKFDEALNKMRPPTCAHIRDRLQSKSCDTCAVRHIVNSPMAFSHGEPAETALLGEYVFDVSTQRFASAKTGAVYSENAFKTRFAHHASKGAISGSLIRNKWGGRVERFAYRPGDEARLIEDSDGWVFNLWRDTGVKPVPGDCSVILEHIERLVPQEPERVHLLRYLAFHVQNPGSKISHGIILQGGQGTGKSYLRRLLYKMVGDENCATLEPDMLSQNWTAQWANVQLMCIEEMMNDERLETYNRMKTWLSEEEVTVNEKYLAQYRAATPRAVLVMTNHRLATLLPKDDRRFFVIASDMARADQAYYDRLWTIGLEQAAAFKAYLLGMDTGAFKPGAPPPMTQAKLEMIEDSAPPLERALEEMIADGAPPFHRSLVRLEDIILELQYRLGERPRDRALMSALRTLGLKKREGQVTLDNGTRPRLWIVRNYQYWSSCTPEEVRKELNRNSPTTV